MSHPSDADSDDLEEGGLGAADELEGGAPEPQDEKLEQDSFDPEELSPPDLEELEGFDDDEDEDEGDEDGQGAEDDSEGAPVEQKAVAKKTKKEEEEEPPGPDIPAPPRKKLLEAMQWAFEKEQVEPELIERFADHAHMVLDANRRVNLTSILDPREMAAKHYLDCWRVTQMASLMGRTILDLGSGAGYPGILLAMAEPHCKVVLVDYREEKAQFHEECIDKLGIKNCSSHGGRAEDYLATNRVDMVVVRDVSSVRENVRTLRKVRHSLKDYLMLKGNSWSREVRAGEREAERLGFTLDTVWEHELPEEMGKRAILVYRAPGAL
jgi:16S rRNA (guanine527-N7)-methyltransferase